MKWISVKERLPELSTGRDLLILEPTKWGPSYTIARFVLNNEFWSNDGSIDYLHHPTHWIDIDSIPLPELPDEVSPCCDFKYDHSDLFLHYYDLMEQHPTLNEVCKIGEAISERDADIWVERIPHLRCFCERRCWKDSGCAKHWPNIKEFKIDSCND